MVASSHLWGSGTALEWWCQGCRLQSRVLGLLSGALREKKEYDTPWPCFCLGTNPKASPASQGRVGACGAVIVVG